MRAIPLKMFQKMKNPHHTAFEIHLSTEQLLKETCIFFNVLANYCCGEIVLTTSMTNFE